MSDNNRIPTPFEIAVKMQSLGYVVIPGGGGETGKKPLVEWKEFETRGTALEQILEWEDQFHPKAWGIVTGPANGTFEIDDDTSGGSPLFNGHKAHVKTPRGGTHRFYKYPNFKVITKAGVLPHIDSRGEGGYSQFAGKTPDGQYEIIELPIPELLPTFDSLPDALKVALRNASEISQPISKPSGKLFAYGVRHDKLYRIASGLRGKGMSEASIYEAMKAFYEHDCEHTPPIYSKELHEIAESAGKYALERESVQDSQGKESVNLVCMADVVTETVDWLWHPYIPKGKVTLLEGDPGIGKSWASLAIATAVTLGKGLPEQEATEPSNVVMASAEDGLGDTIRPRLDAMGADVNRIFAIDGALTLDENGFALLETYLEKRLPDLLIIDPLVAYLGAGVDIHRANETRAVMSQLARLAEKFDVAIIAVRHLTKGGMSKAIYRGIGSIDFTAACRSVLLAGRDAENPQNRALVQIKSNLAPMGKAIGYELKEDDFYWTGESTLTAAQILAADSGDRTSELDEAVTFLKDELAEGPILAKDVYRDAEGVGISKRTLERAKTKLQAKSRKIGDTWYWCLTESTSPTSPIQNLGDLENIEAKKEGLTEGVGDLDLKTALGMSVSEALKIWTVKGAPVIHLGPGENCLDLEKLLANKDVKPEHLLAVADWLMQRVGR